MKKYISLLSIFMLVASNLYGQVIQKRSWSDGDPTFSHVSDSQRVIIDSNIRLIPIYETHTADSFQLILDGIDTIWPQQFTIDAAYDVDYVYENNKHYYIITDGSGQRVFEINFTDPNNPIKSGFDFHGHLSDLINPWDASVFYENGNRKILITDNGGHRVIKVDHEGGDEEWSYGTGDAGIGKNRLSGPSDAIAIHEPDSSILYLISDQGNCRVILVNPRDNSILWTYGEVDQLNPIDIEYDKSTHSVLITDQGNDADGKDNHRVILVSIADSSIIWQFGTGEIANTDSTLNTPTDADFLDNGHILICDAGNNRLLEVDRDKEIIWSYKHRHLKNLRDADRLPDNRTIIIANHTQVRDNIPIWLGYSKSDFISETQSLGKKVNFESISWSDRTPPNTRVKLQLRSADNLADLAAATWYGPSDSDSFFVNPTSDVNQVHHRAHSYYQFRAYLETEDVLTTPILYDFQLQYHYYNENESGTIISEIISDPDGDIITSWENLYFRTIIKSETGVINISILDAASGEVLKDFYAEDMDTVFNREPLDNVDELKEVQAVRLKATLSTNNTATTPYLDDWKIEWESTITTTSQINFVNANKEPVSYYRTSPTSLPKEEYVDRIFVLLNDQNLAVLQNAITLQIKALRNGDLIDVLLRHTHGGDFIIDDPGIRAIINNVDIPNNTSLEVVDRDTIVISYTDPTTPTDQCSDSALIIQNSGGILQIVQKVNASYVPIDSADIGDTIYVSITGEMDQNITFAQDTLEVEVSDKKTYDTENLLLVEQPDTNNNFYTGNFISPYGLVLTKGSISDDDSLQTEPGSQIVAEYVDNVTLRDIIYVPRGSEPPDDTTITEAQPVGAIDFDIAPNPFYVGRHTTLKIRASSSFGDLRINQIEIYNLAGFRIRTISRNQLPQIIAQTIDKDIFVSNDNWWDLSSDDGDPVSSGTYWVKINCSLVTENGEGSDKLIAFRKLIIIR